ncbi:hypothetical protein Taro_032255 [Colocasia esculenta]|uniref:Uncharacterized protein n=1 Tax=Colocasia esculenta TaxID=4460 RepID=A0A843VWU8_COLES|nr:hypothetical protein [Colocasia esculenta]
MTPAEPVESNTMRKQPSARTRRDKKLTEHQSNHVRPESHDTSTNIPDLHEVRKEQPGVTTRDTEQPRETDVSPPTRLPRTSTRSRAHKQNHPGPRTRHEARELHTRRCHCHYRRHQGTGYRKQQSGVYTRHPERTRSTEATKHGQRGQTDNAHEN